MGRPPIPTLGHPSRKAAVLALRAEGLSPKEIAARIGTRAHNVRQILHEAGMVRLTPSPLPGRQFYVGGATIEGLMGPAARRGEPVGDLARRLLGVLAADPALVDAVLDDGNAPSGDGGAP